MVQADMISPSTEPQSVIVKKETEGRYIPEVFYRSKNQYGIEVKESAKPTFPVDYLLVNASHASAFAVDCTDIMSGQITHGFPLDPSPLFRSSDPFPIENRHGMEEQTTDRLFSKLGKLGASSIVDSRIEASFDSRRAREKVAKWLSDWHLLAYWNQVGFLGKADIKELARIATSPNLEEPSLLDGLLENDGWQTLMTVVADSTRKFPK